jgi:hypothetical protein
MDPHRKHWNEQQQSLRQALSRPEEHARAIELFLSQHAMLHAAEVSGAEEYSFDDELWDGLSGSDARRIPHKEEHSIAWCIWHLARIEDVTMNLFLAGSEQLFEQDGWAARLKVDLRDTGNAMTLAEVTALSLAVDVDALRRYRRAVGQRTREVVCQLTPGSLRQKVEPARLQRALDEGAVSYASSGLLEYWGGLTFAGLLLMPPTRHCLVHLNEALRLKQRIH